MKFNRSWFVLAIMVAGLNFDPYQAEAQPARPGFDGKPLTLAAPTANGANLVWDAEAKSIEAHAGDEAGHLFFAFTNLSAENVVISNVHPGCGCTTAQIPKLPWTIVPGTNGQIGVTINLQGKSGVLHKNLVVTTDKGTTMLTFKVNILPVVLPQLSAADRDRNMKMAMGDRQAVFKGDCVTCHVQPGNGKYFQALYDADCGICHEGPNRASMVPNLHTLKDATSPEFWRSWIAHGKPGTLMPAFAATEGGPLNDNQISTLVSYLGAAIPARHP